LHRSFTGLEKSSNHTHGVYCKFFNVPSTRKEINLEKCYLLFTNPPIDTFILRYLHFPKSSGGDEVLQYGLPANSYQELNAAAHCGIAAGMA
jgi:hypothetical protein